MKKIAYALLATLSGLVLLLSYRTSMGADLSVVGISAEPPGAESAVSTPSATASRTASASPQGAADETGWVDGTFTGGAVDTRYGAVQVRIVIAQGVITEVEVPLYPSSNRKDVAINASAIPQLVAETVDAQSADISMVSGATFTSHGYLQSLQSALDQAQQ